MLVVETIAKIRRAYFSQGKAIKEICRDLHVSRKVVRKVIRSNATEFRYERSRQPLPRIGPWREQLETILEQNDARSPRERLTLIRIFEDLRALGYGGSYAAVRRYAIAWRERRASTTADAYVPLSFAPGAAYQFDWSHEIALIGGVTITLKVAHVRLCHSRMMFVRAYPRESQEMVFDAHERAFAFFKGACGRGIYDNMKTAVDAVFVGKERQYNRRFLQMCSHHLVEPVACTPQSSLRRLRKLVCVRLGERSGREPGRAGAGALLHAPCPVQKLRRAQRLAARPMLGLCQGPPPYRMAGSDGLGGFRGGAAEAHPVSWPVRRLPRPASLGVEDLPGPFRQQQILGQRQRGRAPG
jgi:transposase